MSTINVLEELREAKLEPAFEGAEHVKVLCPFHADTQKPGNMSVRVVDGGEGKPLGHAKCFACSASVSLPQLLAKVYDEDPNKILVHLAQKYNLDHDTAAIDPKVIDEYAKEIPEILRNELYERNVSDATIKKYKLGHQNTRITIPIANKAGRYVNILRYSPGATQRKFLNAKGRASNRLYPYDQLQYDKIIVAGGPIKALAGVETYNTDGVGVISATGGEAEWESSFNELFSGKQVWVILDVDSAGRSASTKICAELYPFASKVFDVLLPFPDPDQFPKGGFDDYLKHVGKLELPTEKPYEPPSIKKLEETEPQQITLDQAYSPKNVGKRIEVPVNIVGTSTTPCVIPKDFKVTCSRDAKVCALCPVSRLQPGEEFKSSVNKESSAILELVEAPVRGQKKVLARDAGIPAPCNKHLIEIENYQNFEEVRVSQVLNLDEVSHEGERTDQPAYIAKNVEANSQYACVGRMWPHPDTTKATLVLSEAKPLSDDLVGWECNTVFDDLQPKEWTVEGLEEKLKSLYDYICSEHTMIYNRHDMHLLCDLVYHSALLFKWKGRVENGWVQGLIVGDSSQGKTEISTNLRKLYNLGVRLDCKNATVAGLLGGNTQLGDSKKFFVKWGAIPANDRKLVILEEIGGCHPDVLSKLTDMRSTGIAQLPKIETKATKARTRLLAMANPRSNRTINTYTFGVEAVFELLGAPQDVRRFDVAMCVSGEDNDTTEVEATETYSPEMLRDAVLFAWTRTADQIEIPEEMIQESAARLCEKFVEDRIPLVDKGSTHKKIAKLAIALAVRTGSIEGEKVIVRPCHVEYIEKFLDRIYCDKWMAYDKFSEGLKILNFVKDPSMVEEEIKMVPFPKDLADYFAESTFYEIKDIMDFGGCDQDSAQSVISMLRRKKCVIKKKGGYIKSPGFTKFLHSVQWPDTGSGGPGF